ncbi:MULTISPECIES: CpsD/CapB family tyrosine-protein kinase [Leuconostoc]|uniref:CpsD/CapB family tyrosine-protein kinase n=1 Tax=Leuconostoc TaxID=1243 RepID=UPI0009B6522C|nr:MULTISPECIES: CpsD/CapB family tyrosine-protein kinase [Leuconostoc]OQJ70454.1 exopolysaccharide biosynthesis protein [Leuconostoc pseudomesenteroides]MDG9744690.1 CpsD/CapB family tyrosine-protein kinase [Leuconostoc falkenbergense]ORI50183.1 exopolysaccharide biosynthesis protein [Leuconostoc pseudomesenteroides]ORI56939.1 exopolysaccharide biosynthesis protein [Leuconostoc pseudomesenteroides]ORI71777.1 exopolysaccharide biosynthesis protein [Leuconostoc pseudomesenteroides]
MSFFKKRSSVDKDGLSVETMTKGARLITAAEPKNPVSEQFRTLRTNIEFASVSRGEIKTLLISSALPSEGKSTVTSNLAIVYAQQGKKVLLVDADLRRPTVAVSFGLNRNSAGLTNYLGDNHKEISDVVHRTAMDNLDVVPSGPIPPNPAELLGSGRMTELVTQLKSQYDLIIFDVPPFLMVTDAQVLMSKADGVAIVINGGKTNKGALQRTNEILKIAEAPVLGFIYNDQSRRKKGGSGYGYGYGYSYAYGDTKSK